MSLATLLRHRPVFTRAEAERQLTGRDQRRSPRTVDSLLAYHVRLGHLVRVRRGLYAVVPPGRSPRGFQPDPYLLAARAAGDAVLAYHTALEFHGRAYSSFQTFFFLTEGNARSFRYHDYGFRSVALPKSLRARSRRRLEVEEMERGGTMARVTSLERTLVDVLDRVDLAGGWEEAWRSLELVEYFDLDAVVRYCLALQKASTAARVGYFLEQNRERLMVEKRHLGRLERVRPNQPLYLKRGSRGNSLARRWNLIIPGWLADRRWEDA